MTGLRTLVSLGRADDATGPDPQTVALADRVATPLQPGWSTSGSAAIRTRAYGPSHFRACDRNSCVNAIEGRAYNHCLL